MAEHTAVVVVPLALLAGATALPRPQVGFLIDMPLRARLDEFAASAQILRMGAGLEVVEVEAEPFSA